MNSHFGFDLWLHNAKFYLLIVLCVQQSKTGHLLRYITRLLKPYNTDASVTSVSSTTAKRKYQSLQLKVHRLRDRKKKKHTHTHTNVNTKGQSHVDLLFVYKRHRSLRIISYKTVNQSSQNPTTYTVCKHWYMDSNRILSQSRIFVVEPCIL